MIKIINKNDAEIKNIELEISSLEAKQSTLEIKLQLIRLKNYHRSLNEECQLLECEINKEIRSIELLDENIISLKNVFNNGFIKIQSLTT